MFSLALLFFIHRDVFEAWATIMTKLFT